MRRRILLALIMVLIIGTFLAGSTYLLYSSQAKSENNTFTAGTLKLGGVFGSESKSQKFAHLSLAGIKPGQNTLLPPIKLKNVGTLPFKLYRITSSNVSDDAKLAGELNVKVKIGDESVYEGKLSGLVGSNGGYFDSIGNILPDCEKDLSFEVLMDEDAGNDYQNKTLTCDLNIYAIQNEVPANGENGISRFGPARDENGNVLENTFFVNVKNTNENVEFTWDWQPRDDNSWGSFEYYILEIKHETGNPTTDIQSGRLKMKLDPIDEKTETIESTNNILKSDVTVDWDNDQVKIRKDAFPSDWKGFEVEICGVQKFDGKIVSIPYEYWSLNR